MLPHNLTHSRTDLPAEISLLQRITRPVHPASKPSVAPVKPVSPEIFVSRKSEAPNMETESTDLLARKIRVLNTVMEAEFVSVEDYFREVSVKRLASILEGASEYYQACELCASYERFYEQCNRYIELFPDELLADVCPLVADKSNEVFRNLVFSSDITERARKKLLAIFTNSMMVHARHLNLAINPDMGAVSDNSGKTQTPRERKHAGSNDDAFLPGKWAKVEPATFSESRAPDMADKILPDTPVNMIWVGSLISDHYLRNLATVGQIPPGKGELNTPVSGAPKREVILWKDRTLLSERDDFLMGCIPELPMMQGVKVKVLDINDAGLEMALEEMGEKYLSAVQWARDELKNYAMVSDLVRFALLNKGPEAIDCAEGKATLRGGRGGRGMIYMDCDAIDREAIERIQNCGEPVAWWDKTIPLGFGAASENNDFLVCTDAGHPVALHTLHRQLQNLSNPELREQLKAERNDYLANSKSYLNKKRYRMSVLDVSGPDCLAKTLNQLLGCAPEISCERGSIHYFIISERIGIKSGNSENLLQKGTDSTWLNIKSQSPAAPDWIKVFAKKGTEKEQGMMPVEL